MKKILDKILLPFKMIYWRWFWKPVDYDEDPADKKPRDKNHGYRGGDPRDL